MDLVVKVSAQHRFETLVMRRAFLPFKVYGTGTREHGQFLICEMRCSVAVPVAIQIGLQYL